MLLARFRFPKIASQLWVLLTEFSGYSLFVCRGSFDFLAVILVIRQGGVDLGFGQPG